MHSRVADPLRIGSDEGDAKVSELDEAIQAALGQISGLANADAAVAQPIQAGDYTIVPICQVGFGGGFGLGVKPVDETSEKRSGGVGFGGGVRPVAVVIAGPDGVRIEAVPYMEDPAKWGEVLGSLAAKLPKRGK